MAGLPMFGETFRQWMSGNGPHAVRPSSVDAKDHMFMTSKPSSALSIIGSASSPQPPSARQSGIRQNTDESWILPSSNDILQHLSESYRNGNDQHISIDGQRCSSDASTVCNPNVPHTEVDPYDSIEAEIEQLKKDVAILRQTQDKDQPASKVEQELAGEPFLVIHGKGSLSSPAPKYESAAARLQRQHETITPEHRPLPHETPRKKPSLSPLDFPALGGLKTPSKSPSSGSARQPRKTSYADAASNGMLQAIDSAFSASASRRRDTKASDSTSDELPSTVSMTSPSHTTSSVTTQDSCQLRIDDDCSVIISRPSIEIERPADDTLIKGKGMRSTPNGKSARQGPHFAQPTQSFSRRTGETLRHYAASTSPKSPLESSPNKSAKAKEPDLTTFQRATLRQQKRKSLPGNWLGSHGEQKLTSDTPTPTSQTDPKTTPNKVPLPASTISQVSVESCSTGKTSQARKNVETSRVSVRETQSQSPPRKKAGSYMSPTTAATCRAIATLGPDKIKRKPLTVEAAAVRDEVTGAAGTTVPVSAQCTTESKSRSCTITSDQSSVQFILEQLPNASTEPKLTETYVPKDVPQLGPDTVNIPSSVSSPVTSPHKTMHRNISRIPKAALHAGRPTQHQTPPGAGLSTSMASAHSVALSAAIPNTTLKRRMSHGHLLLPIVSRLHSKGLLNKTSTNNAIIESYLNHTSNELIGVETGNVSHVSPRLNGTGREVSTGTTFPTLPKTAIALHLRRSRETSRASTPGDATISLEPPIICNMQSSAIVPSYCAPDVSNVIIYPGPDALDKPRTSSLRATASEFKPMSFSMDRTDQVETQTNLDWKSHGRWAAMDPSQRQELAAGSQAWEPRGTMSSNTFSVHQTPPEAPSGFPVRDSWTKFAPRNDFSAQTVKFVNDNGSPNAVQVGQVLKPSLSPGKKTVQWMLQDVDGTETPLKLGRAPAPTNVPVFEATTPSISSISEDTSPSKTPYPQRQWHIGSALSRAPYGWSGGDGKEIRFIGYGPHAKRDPNSVVNFNFQGHTSSHNVSVPNGFYEDKENFEVGRSVAPKSQRQWAEMMGYSKVPCGNVNVVNAVEFCAPFGSDRPNSYCFDCVLGH